MTTPIGKCESVVEYRQPEMDGSEDAVQKMTAGLESGATFPKGETTLSFEATDKTGQKADCQFKVTVKDEEAPVVKCPADISIKTEPGAETAKAEYTAATATDNCSTLTPEKTTGPDSGSDFPTGQTTITYSATDEAGNKSECSFKVTVEGTAKVLTLKCPEDIKISTETGKCEKAVEYRQPVMDGPSDASLKRTGGSESGSFFPKGETVLSFEATDKTGQEAKCEFKILVVDEEPPVMKCPSDITVKTEPGEETLIVDYTPATATDICGKVTNQKTAGPDSGSEFPIGQTTITYSATDEAGNKAECSFKVTVEGIAKVLTLKCPEDLKFTTEKGKCEKTITYAQPKMEGPKDAVLKMNTGLKSGSSFPKGETSLTFEATDKTGQKADCQFKVTVVDEEAPVIKCPSDITAKTEPGAATQKVEYTAATATDNCGNVSVQKTAGPESGSDFPIGQTQVKYSVSDESGNAARVQFFRQGGRHGPNSHFEMP